MYEIEDNVPIPIGIHHTEFVDLISRLEPKQSVYIPGYTGSQMLALMQTLRKRLKRKFVVRTSPKGVRIWRVE